MAYRPKSDYEKNIFPNLGTVRVLWGSHTGEIGTIIAKNSNSLRVAFDKFWDRPDGMDPEEADDSGHYFLGEFEYV